MADTHSTQAAATVYPCGHCGEEATQQCGQCKNMRYCSLECQQADWRFHKALRKQYPSKHRIQGHSRYPILLLPHKEAPVFLELPCETGSPAVADAFADEDADEDVLSAENIEARERADRCGVPVTDATNTTHLPGADTLCGYARAKGKSYMLVCGKLGKGARLAYSVQMVNTSHAFTAGNKTPNKCLARLHGAEAA